LGLVSLSLLLVVSRVFKEKGTLAMSGPTETTEVAAPVETVEEKVVSEQEAPKEEAAATPEAAQEDTAEAAAEAPAPAAEEAPALFSVESGSFAMKGCRPTMEDEHITIDDITEDFESQVAAHGRPCAYYGIYDGHRGSQAAEFVAETLHNKIVNSDKFKEGDVEGAIHDGFLATDKELLDTARAADEPWQDGCTAAVAIILGTKLYTANLGDAEILLGRQKEDGSVEAVELTHKHKPSDPVEKARIVSQGGLVLCGRVGGALAVARAFGDLEFKTPIDDEDKSLAVGKLLSEEPFVLCTELIPKRDLFVIVGCDGVWERLGHQASVNFVAEHLPQEGPEATSEMLANHAFNMRSQDNISATIVMLQWH